jgi:3-hydroxyacyl-CoA dehydrogenase
VAQRLRRFDVADGIAYRPLEVDVIYLDGYEFPAERGSPMFFADRIGLLTVLEKCRQFSQGHQGWASAAAPLLAQ